MHTALTLQVDADGTDQVPESDRDQTYLRIGGRSLLAAARLFAQDMFDSREYWQAASLVAKNGA
jgi:hypothetical protein